MRCELGALTLPGIRRHWLSLLTELSELHVRGPGTFFAIEVDILQGKPLERGRPILETLFDRLLIPFAKSEYAGLDTNERILLVTLLDEGGEPRPHRYLRALADMAEEVLLDRYVSDLLVV
jgi:hypothetical protein